MSRGSDEQVSESAKRLQAFIRRYVVGECRILSEGERCPCLLCDVSRLAGAALVAVDTQEHRKATINNMRLALCQCLVHIEADEVTHGRQFAAGNVARAALKCLEEGQGDGR